MDDKEKEKFGVIIDKEKQPDSDQPKVDENTPKDENQIVENQNIDVSEVNQPENENNQENFVQNEKTKVENDTNVNLSASQQDKTEEITNNSNENDFQQTNNENKVQEEKKDHQVIHKKDGRLHIYVRQDKYKGELKSKNWVGRIYLDGKQKIFSSGTPNLDDAIPILEKWFDDLHAQKEKEQNNEIQSDS